MQVLYDAEGLDQHEVLVDHADPGAATSSAAVAEAANAKGAAAKRGATFP
jgi:hypothetical protein